MRRVTFLLAAVLLATLAGCGKPNVKALLKESRELAQKGDQESWESVRNNLHKVLVSGKLSPKVEGADRLHNFYVHSLIHTGRDTEALKAAENAVNYFPENFMSNYLLGKVHSDQGNYPAAVPYLEEANTRKANDVNTLALLTKAAGKTNNANAGTYFAQASELPEFADDPKLYNSWGMWLAEQGQPVPATHKLVQAAKMKNADPGVFLNLAIIYDRDLKITKPAQNYYRKFLIEIGKTGGGRDDERRRVQQRLRELAKN